MDTKNILLNILTLFKILRIFEVSDNFQLYFQQIVTDVYYANTINSNLVRRSLWKFCPTFFFLIAKNYRKQLQFGVQILAYLIYKQCFST
jgi:hypothetical protein